MLTQKLREHAKSGVHTLFLLGQKAGWDILPRHFYSSIPDINELRVTEKWKAPCSMDGVAGADIDAQMGFLRECCPEHLYERLRQGGVHEYACRVNGAPGFGPIESDFLFCFIATKRPAKIIQIGAGVSTAVILLAAEEAGYHPEIVCVDPIPTAYLIQQSRQGSITLLKEKAQDIDLNILTDLNNGDLLFIDSSHAVRPGSEVNRVILEILPRLKSGGWVHFHDIYFPYDYPSSVLTTLFFAGESTLLHAFLIHNRRYAIAVSLSMLHHTCAKDMQLVLPNYQPVATTHGLYPRERAQGHFPSSIYLSVQ